MFMGKLVNINCLGQFSFSWSSEDRHDKVWVSADLPETHRRLITCSGWQAPAQKELNFTACSKCSRRKCTLTQISVLVSH